jgi:hypothetical protein
MGEHANTSASAVKRLPSLSLRAKLVLFAAVLVAAPGVVPP